MGDLDIENMVLADGEKLALLDRQWLEHSGTSSSAANITANRAKQSDSTASRRTFGTVLEQPGAVAFQVPDQLSGDEYNQLVEALMSAFLERESLSLMVRRTLQQKLNLISQGASGYETTVDRLVEWAESQGKLQVLVEGALTKNPGNLKLNNLVKSWRHQG